MVLGPRGFYFCLGRCSSGGAGLCFIEAHDPLRACQDGPRGRSDRAVPRHVSHADGDPALCWPKVRILGEGLLWA